MARAAALFVPVPSAAWSVVVEASVVGTLAIVVEVAAGLLLQAEAPKPTATRPRATSSLGTLRGYPRGQAETFAPVIGERRSGI